MTGTEAHVTGATDALYYLARRVIKRYGSGRYISLLELLKMIYDLWQEYDKLTEKNSDVY